MVSGSMYTRLGGTCVVLMEVATGVCTCCSVCRLSSGVGLAGVWTRREGWVVAM